MQIFPISSALTYLLIFAHHTSVTKAAALPSDEVPSDSETNSLRKRCDKPCGFYSQICCAANEVCFTDANNQARCGVAQNNNQGAPASPAPTQANPGNWQYYTTTYVMTDLSTVTTTYSSYFGQTTQNNVVPTAAPSNCQYSLGEIPCGATCCSSGQYCMTDVNQCAAAGGGGSSGYYSSFYTGVPSAPVRPTSNTVLTVTSTGVPTTTVPFSAPVGTDGTTIIGPVPQTSGGGLSAGAIAGIVIGVLIAIILLIVFCLCCCAKEALEGIIGIFTGGRKKRTETTYIEERHSHHGSRPPPARTWWGGRPARVDRTEKKSSGLGGLAKVGGALAVLGVGLGLKRKRDRRHDNKSRSDYSEYDDRYTDDTSESSLSSDRRTRDSRRSRRH